MPYLIFNHQKHGRHSCQSQKNSCLTSHSPMDNTVSHSKSSITQSPYTIQNSTNHSTQSAWSKRRYLPTIKAWTTNSSQQIEQKPLNRPQVHSSFNTRHTPLFEPDFLS